MTHRRAGRQHGRPWPAVTVLVGMLVGTVAAAPSRGDAPATRPATAPATPDYRRFTQSYHVPFSNTVQFDHLTTMLVRVSVNGGPARQLQVDTGSVGVILTASDIPNVDPHAPPGSILYTSSGVEIDGVWTPTTITFLDAKDAQGHPATAVVPVLAAQERIVHPGAVNGGRPQDVKNPRVYMMGVGFGRGLVEGHPERNPFLNLTEMRAGTMRRGYTITRDGYTLGLTAADVGTGYRFQHLVERTVAAESRAADPGLKDWKTSRGWLTVGGVREPETAILLDTGLTNFMIPDPRVAENAPVPAGTPITVDLLGGQLHYSFNAAAPPPPPATRRAASGPATTRPMARAAARGFARLAPLPDPVVPLKVTRYPTTNPAANVNTGLRALAIYDYLYDADGGYLGLRPTAEHP